MDSKGRVHAVWVEQSHGPSGDEDALLWYSTHDPTTGIRRSSLVDRSVSIYSLGMVVDGFNNAHMVWVTAPVTLGLRRSWASFEETLERVNYLSSDPGGLVSGSPRLIFASPAHDLWVSITLGYDSALYLAWTETFWVNSTAAESSAYYGRLDIRGETIDLDRTLLGKTSGMSRMVKSATSPDHRNLFLAWVDEFVQGNSRVMYSRVDLSGNLTAATTVDELDGGVSALSLAASSGGDVFVGWAPDETVQDEPFAYLAKLSRDGVQEITDLDVQSLKREASLHSLTVDSSGNMHLVWVGVTEDLLTVPRPIRLSQPRIYHLRVPRKGLSEGNSERLSQGVAAAFVAEDGKLYAAIGGGPLQAVRPIESTVPVIFLLTLFLSALTTLGLATEAGTYAIAGWRTTSGRPRGRFTKSARRPDARLLSKIKMHPGITLSELRSISPGDTYLLAVYLRLLEASGMVRSVRERAKQRFYCLSPIDGPTSRAEELRRSLLELVQSRPGVTEADIARKLELSQQLANYHLKLLTEARLLSRLRHQGKVGYFVNRRLVQVTRQQDN